VSAASRRTLTRICTVYLPVAVLLVLALFPFYWMLIASLKVNAELYNLKANPFIVLQPTLDHYVYLLTKIPFVRWATNTLIVATASTIISLFAGIPAGYALGRVRFKGASTLGIVVFITYLVPQTLLFLALGEVVNALNLLDNLWALILTYPTFLIPFSAWLLMGYFKTIPLELDESAMIDGATRLQTMIRVIIPLATSGILSAAIFSFTLSWNEFIYALIFLSSTASKTLPIGVVTELVRGDVFFWGELMAGALLGSLPVAFIYSFFVDQYTAGLTTGAVKG